MTVCYHTQSILRSFLIVLNRITMQLLISRKAAMIRTWIFFTHTRRVMQRGSSSGSLCRYLSPNLHYHLHLMQWYIAPSAIFIAGVFFSVSGRVHLKLPKSRWHWSPGLAVEHCSNALFWTSVGTCTQANIFDWYLHFSSENLPGLSGSAFLQVKHSCVSPFWCCLLIYFTRS